MTDRAQEIANELLGTCTSIHDVIESHEHEDLTLMSELDEYALMCDTCGWWFSPEEIDTTDGDCTCGECFDNA
jgi:hypothetical protein